MSAAARRPPTTGIPVTCARAEQNLHTAVDSVPLLIRNGQLVANAVHETSERHDFYLTVKTNGNCM